MTKQFLDNRYGASEQFYFVIVVLASCGGGHQRRSALDRDVKVSQLGPLWDSYVTTENEIKESRLHFMIFQNNLYAETPPFFLADQVYIGISLIYFINGEDI